MGKAPRLPIQPMDKEIKTTHRICCIDIGSKTFRNKDLRRALLSLDIAHISSKKQ
jgi:hypothetical protein